MEVTFTVTLEAPEGFSITNAVQSGTIAPLQFEELVFPVEASSDLTTETIDYFNITVDYTVDGTEFIESTKATIEVRKLGIVELRKLIEEALENLMEWKEMVAEELSPILEVTATPSLAEVDTGDSVDVTVTVENTGTGTASNVKLTISPTDAFSLRTATTLSIESIDAGDSETETFGLTAKSDAQAGTYSPSITYEYDNVLAASMGLSATKTGSTTFSISVKKKGLCMIATATYGSELSPEVQFLRGFRDQAVMPTFVGAEGMAVFNQIYYSFSPNVARFIAGNPTVRVIVKALLYPLMGILHIVATSFSLFTFNPELGITTAALLASSLIGAIYFSPWALIIITLVKRYKKKTPRMATLKLFAAPWLIGFALMGVAGITMSGLLIKIAASMLVLTTTAISATGTVLILSRGFTRIREVNLKVPT